MALQKFLPVCPCGCAESHSAVTVASRKSKCPSMTVQAGAQLISEETRGNSRSEHGSFPGFPNGLEDMESLFERQMERAIPRKMRWYGIRGDICGIGSSGRKSWSAPQNEDKLVTSLKRFALATAICAFFASAALYAQSSAGFYTL